MWINQSFKRDDQRNVTYEEASELKEDIMSIFMMWKNSNFVSK